MNRDEALKALDEHHNACCSCIGPCVGFVEALTVLSAPVTVCTECGGTGEIAKGLQGFRLPCKCVSPSAPVPVGEVAIEHEADLRERLVDGASDGEPGEKLYARIEPVIAAITAAAERAGYERALADVESWNQGNAHRDLERFVDVLEALRSKLTQPKELVNV